MWITDFTVRSRTMVSNNLSSVESGAHKMWDAEMIRNTNSISNIEYLSLRHGGHNLPPSKQLQRDYFFWR
jgi:hypothetical protein